MMKAKEYYRNLIKRRRAKKAVAKRTKRAQRKQAKGK